jgi:C4-dicarboxylate-specific signal transduction histidine kinase
MLQSCAMTAESTQLHALRRLKRRNYLGCAALLLMGLGLQALVQGAFVPRLALVQLAWSAGFVLLGLAVGWGWVPVRVTGIGGGLLSLLGLGTLIHFSGGPSSPYFPLMGALPITVAVFTPGSRTPTVVASVVTLGTVAILDLLSGLAMRVMLVQLANFCMVGAVAVLAAQAYQRLWNAEKVAQQERLEALEQLADSERRRLRSERERAEVDRLVLVGQLAAGVAHEVNNPLAFVKSNLCFLEQELEREDRPLNRAEMGDVLAETQQGVLRIQQIVTDLRRFSREDGDGIEELGLAEDAMHEARRLASVRLREVGEVSLDCSPGLPPVRLGQRHMVQVLLNLLLNAADAVQEALPRRRAHIVVRAREVEGGVRLEVEDNGPGIRPEVMGKLFEPFFTTKPPDKGTGLGLALCREYVSRAGGTLVAENRAEGGARFVLEVPVGLQPLEEALASIAA